MRFWRGVGLACFHALSPLICGADAALEPPPSPWDISGTFRAGGGYKDNILLAHSQTASSGFSLASAEIMALRAPVDAWEFTSILFGEDRRFWQSPSVDKEQLFFGMVEAKRRFFARWKAGLNAQYFYNDQVFDASIAEDLLIRVRAQSHRFAGSPSAQVELPRRTRIELSFPVARQEFEELLDGWWEFGPKLVIAKKFAKSSEVTLSGQYRDRSYDHRKAPGPVIGTSVDKPLHFRQEEAELAVRHTWDGEKHWKSRLRVGFELSEDNGAGRFDYQKYRVSKDLTFTKGGFEGMLQAKFLHYEFVNQKTLAGDKTRRRSELDLGFRLKQGISRHMSFFLESDFEWGLATDPIERYEAATVVGGLEWSFE